MRAKNCEKIHPLGHFSRRALVKKLQFCSRKIKRNRDLVGMLQNFTHTSIKKYI